MINAEPTGKACPWCLAPDPNMVGIVHGRVCRDPFHCPVPDGHGSPFRICPYCDWREDRLVEPPAGWALVDDRDAPIRSVPIALVLAALDDPIDTA